jgi:hypothetical protein
MNFLQKGLAGLESRLDKVLLDEGNVVTTPPSPVPPLLPLSLPAITGLGDGRRDPGKGECLFLLVFRLSVGLTFGLRGTRWES